MKRLQLASIILAPALAASLLGMAGRPNASRVDVVAGRLNAPRVDVVPPAVTIAEGLAEDIQADLETRNWTMARTRVAQLQKNRLRLRVLLPAPKIAGYEVAFDSLTAQLKRQDRLASLQSANHMSREIVNIMGNYTATVPVQVGYLDVAGRDAIYAAEAGRWEDAVAAAAELRVNYFAVQPHVASKDPALARRVGQLLADLDGAVTTRSVARIRATATRVLDDVDVIERTY
jgi:hypothetical protein